MHLDRLEQLKHLSQEIELLKCQIEKIESQVVTDVVVGSASSSPYLAHSIIISGVNHNKIKRLKLKLNYKLNELIEAQEHGLDYISTVEDSEVRQLLTLRYVDGLTWQQVAHSMGRSGDGSTERKKVNRFLQVSRDSRRNLL